MSKNILFNLRATEKVALLEFTIEGGVLSPSDLSTIELPKDFEYNKPLVLSGRGPHWLYQFLVHEVHFVNKLCTFEPRLNKGIIIEAPSNELLGKAIDLETGNVETVELGAKGQLVIKIIKLKHFDVIAIKIEGDRFIEPSILSTINWELLKQQLDRKKTIVFYGQAPIWLGARMAAEFSNFGRGYGVFDPRLGVVIVARHHPEIPEIGTVLQFSESELQEINDVMEHKETKIIAICGDPNSGKSVFLHLLNDELRRRNKITLTQEGDLFAPTQQWSLFSPEIRKELKKHMDPEQRLQWILDSLKTIKQQNLIDFILVDIGGGKPNEGLRVTKENREILKYVDYAIICSRDERLQTNAWFNELKMKTPHVKIVGILESIYPDKTGEKAYFESQEDLIRGAVSFLDREAYKNKEIPENTIAVIRALVDKLLQS